MRLIKYFFFTFIFSFTVEAESIASIKLSYILENSIEYIKFLDNLNSKKILLENKLQISENQLLEKKQEIEESKIILSQEEFNIQIDSYNKEAEIFQEKLLNYNNLFNQSIENNKNIILQEIALIAKDIAIQNNFSFIFNENQYFLASDDIDISGLVVDILNKKKINFTILDELSDL